MKLVKDIQPKVRKRYSQIYASKTRGEFNAEIVNNTYIRIYGRYDNHVKGPKNFDRIFFCGDWAEYGSYNLKYNGRITTIGNKTVTIQHYENQSDVTRMDLYSFIDRNWDFDLIASQKYNSEEMHCI